MTLTLEKVHRTSLKRDSESSKQEGSVTPGGAFVEQLTQTQDMCAATHNTAEEG